MPTNRLFSDSAANATFPNECPRKLNSSGPFFYQTMSKLGCLANTESLSYGNEIGSQSPLFRYHRTRPSVLQACPGKFQTYHCVPNIFNIKSETHTNSDDVNLTPSSDQQHNLASLMQRYMGRDDDESYRKWVETKILEQRQLQEKKKTLGDVPQNIKDLPGHYNPTRTETTNQTYGKYNDLLPKFPAEYPLPALLKYHPIKLTVRLIKSNISDRLPIPDHHFALDPESQINSDGFYTISGQNGGVHFPEVPGVQVKKPYTYQRNLPILGEIHGERKPDHTLPLLCKTGLEINRPI